MATIRLRLPPGKSSLSVGGQVCAPDGEGCILVDEAHARECRRHGCTPAPMVVTAPVPEEGEGRPKRKRGTPPGGE